MVTALALPMHAYQRDAELDAEMLVPDPATIVDTGRGERLRRLLMKAEWRNPTVRAAMGTTGTNAVILLLNIMTGIITARILAPAGRGEQAAITMWPQFLGFAFLFGLPTSLVYHMQRRDHERSDLMSAAFVCGLAASLVGTAVGMLAIPISLRAYDPYVVHVAQLAMLFTPFGVALNLLVAAFVREGSFATYNVMRLASPVLTLVTLAVLALFHALTPVSSSLAYLVPSAPVMMFALFQVRRRVGFSRRIDLVATKALLKYGIACYGYELIGAVSAQLDRILVVWLLTPAAMGLYVVALSFSRIFQQLPLSISTVILPKVTTTTSDRAVRFTVRAAWISAGLSVVTALPAIALAPFILSTFFGPEFASAAPVFVILTVEAIIGGYVAILGQGYIGMGRPIQTSFYSLIGLATIVPLLLLLGYRYGLVGVAMAILGSTGVRALLMTGGLRRLSRTSATAADGPYEARAT